MVTSVRTDDGASRLGLNCILRCSLLDLDVRQPERLQPVKVGLVEPAFVADAEEVRAAREAPRIALSA